MDNVHFRRKSDWVVDYLAPLFIGKSLKEVRENYRRNRQYAYMRELEEAGVYDSLQKLEEKQTDWDIIRTEWNEKIKRARPKEKNRIDMEELLNVTMREHQKERVAYCIYVMPAHGGVGPGPGSC